MAVQASWIRENMFPICEDTSRRLTEAELKVQKSLQKLSIPQWYLNNASKAPKIVNDIPIDCRPASWKTENYKKNPSTIFQDYNKSISDLQALLYAYKKDKTDDQNVSNCSVIAQNGTVERKTPTKKRLSTSGTFPRMSVSRKIQNINIVLPPHPKLDLSIEGRFNSANSFSDTSDSSRESKSVMVTDLDNPRPEYLKALQVANKTFTRPSSPRRPELEMCRTPDFKDSALENFKVRTASTPLGSPVSVFSTSHMDSPLRKPIRALPRTIFDFLGAAPPQPPESAEKAQPVVQKTEVVSVSVQTEGPKPAPRILPRQVLRAKNLELCESCKAEKVRVRVIMVSPRSPIHSPAFRSSLLPIDENQTATVSRHSSSASSQLAFILAKKKSTLMENMIKRKRIGGQSLIRDIIEELEEKCRSSPQPTYTSPGSRNFVRKLVRALERNDDDAGLKCGHRYQAKCSSESSSEPDIKSAASSTTISIRDSDSGSDLEPRSPLSSEPRSPLSSEPCSSLSSEPRSPLSSEPDYNWAVNAKKEEKKLEEEEEEESVFWVPVQKTLPRTSSVLSITSSGRQSPCVSPIKLQNSPKMFQSDGTGGGTYRPVSSQQKRRFRIDESGVMDSGYSDRSERSSTDACWSDYEYAHGPSDMSFVTSTLSRPKNPTKRSVIIGTSVMV